MNTKRTTQHTLVTVTVPPHAADINFVLFPNLPPDLHVKGMVYDDEGQPAAIAVVSLAMAGTLQKRKLVYFDGSYLLTLRPGTYSITAGGALPIHSSAAGGRSFAGSAAQEITLPSDETNLNFTVLRADNYIFGQVVDEAGQPVCGVQIEATGESASAAAHTNNSGRYALRLPAGTYALQASISGFASLPQTIAVPPTVGQRNFVVSASANTVEASHMTTATDP